MGWKTKAFEWFICQRNRHSKGNSEMDFFIKLILYFMGAEAYIKLRLGITLPYYIIIILMAGYMCYCWGFGWVWDKWNLYTIEMEWGNKRNAFIKEMRAKFHDFKGKV